MIFLYILGMMYVLLTIYFNNNFYVYIQFFPNTFFYIIYFYHVHILLRLFYVLLMFQYFPCILNNYSILDSFIQYVFSLLIIGLITVFGFKQFKLVQTCLNCLQTIKFLLNKIKHKTGYCVIIIAILINFV